MRIFISKFISQLHVQVQIKQSYLCQYLVDSEQIKLNRTLRNHKNVVQQLYTSTPNRPKYYK